MGAELTGPTPLGKNQDARQHTQAHPRQHRDHRQARLDRDTVEAESAAPASVGGGGGGSSQPAGAQPVGAAPPEQRGEVHDLSDYQAEAEPVAEVLPDWGMIAVGLAFVAGLGFLFWRRI